jgi:hypothetical protein
MDSRQFEFLKAVLGENGAVALQKATNRSELLEKAILPRTILAWLSVISRGAFDGALPGTEESLNFKKSENTFTGQISIQKDVFTFDNASLFDLGAAVAVSLGVDLQPNLKALKSTDLINLGKSIDTLVKAHLAEELVKKQAKIGLPGQTAKPQEPQAPAAPTPTQLEAPKAPKPKLPKLNKATLKIKKSQIYTRCQLCSMKCFHAIADGVKVLEKGLDLLLEFDPEMWGPDEVGSLAESLEYKNV